MTARTHDDLEEALLRVFVEALADEPFETDELEADAVEVVADAANEHRERRLRAPAVLRTAA